MKKSLSKTEAQDRIKEFFLTEEFTSEKVKKIKRLAMKYNLKLGMYRRLFCNGCLSKLKGKIRITKTHKIVECQNCKYKNKFKL